MPVEVICKFSKIKFEGKTKRTQVHPQIAVWKQEALKRGWYSRFFAAIDYGLSNGNLLSGNTYTKKLDLKPGDEFEIILGRKHINLKPIGQQSEVNEVAAN